VKISYVMGNHDHHLVVMSQKKDFPGRGARGDIYSVCILNLNWNQTLDGLSIDITAFAELPVRSRHHLKGVQAFSIQLADLPRNLSGE
jgi:hypothetical protein